MQFYLHKQHTFTNTDQGYLSTEQDSNKILSLCHSPVRGICSFWTQHLYITTATKLWGEFFLNRKP